MERELFNDINIKPGDFSVATDNTAVTSGIVDLQGFESCTFLIRTGSLADADATFATTLQASDNSDLSSPVDVTDAGTPDDLVGTLADCGFDFSKDNKVFKVGYKGTHRYVKLTVTPSNNTGAAQIAIDTILGHARTVPTANPPN